MPAGNSYPAPTLPLTGAEQFTGYQQQGAIIATVTISISQLAQSITASSFTSPPAIGSVTPNVGTFTLLTVADYLATSVDSAVAAAGSSQTTSTLLDDQWNVITSVGASTGVQLPDVAAGTPVRVFHNAAGGHVLSVYPPAGQQIGSLSVNAPSGMIFGQANDFCYIGGGLWIVK
jgi:hypothetical protein